MLYFVTVLLSFYNLLSSPVHYIPPSHHKRGGGGGGGGGGAFPELKAFYEKSSDLAAKKITQKNMGVQKAPGAP